MVTEDEWTRWSIASLRPYQDAALDAFGADRLMVGSDWPVCLVATSYPRWWSSLRAYFSSSSQSERAAVFGGTAVQFTDLPRTPAADPIRSPLPVGRQKGNRAALMQISNPATRSTHLQEAGEGLILPGASFPFTLITALFFLWGMSNNLTDILVQQFRKSFTLTQIEAQLVQTAVFLGYFLMALPAAAFMRRRGRRDTKLGGSVIVMAVIGGAVFPPLLGLVARLTGSYALGYLVPIVAYGVIAAYSASIERFPGPARIVPSVP